ncbi:MAG TPA: fatty acid desaturase, partial [Polyangiaceae bacterium]|nr:fatty acid desaturase [Polyangiaceae bacterium]
NHDASHRGLFRSPALNKGVATVLSVWPMMHHPEAWSFVQWRRVHILHHRYLFTARDPNYVGRERRGDTVRAFTLGRLAFACVRAAMTSPLEFFVGRQDAVDAALRECAKGQLGHLRALFLPFSGDPEMERERRAKWVAFAVAVGLVVRTNLWQEALIYWMVPMYTVYPMILTFMDLTEHAWAEKGSDLNRIARSTMLGWAANVVVGNLPRTLHREHHAFPGVCATDLLSLSRLLDSAGVAPEPLRGISGLLRDVCARPEARPVGAEAELR